MATIKLANFNDLTNVRAGILPVERVRELELDALVDTGAISLAVPADVAELLGAPVIGQRRVRVADGRSLEVPYVGGLYIEILGRSTTCNALVLPAGSSPLLGAVQLEELDLVVIPATREVIANPAHPEGIVLPLLGLAS